jgi:hypothetical protein
VVMPTGDRDRIGRFVDQVKLTHALDQDLDEAIKEVTIGRAWRGSKLEDHGWRPHARD